MQEPTRICVFGWAARLKPGVKPFVLHEGFFVFSELEGASGVSKTRPQPEPKRLRPFQGQKLLEVISMCENVAEETLSTWADRHSNREGWESDCHLKCMVCGKRLRIVHSNHLERHSLTIEQYLSRFPGAKVYSERYIQSLKRNFWKRIGKRRERICVNCGATFTTHSPNKVRCDLCQRVYRLEALKHRERLRRRSWKGVKQIMGTKGESINLKVLRSGRVAAAVWLEKNKGRGEGLRRMFNGGGEEPQCQICDSTYLLLIEDGQPYCTECGGRIVIARENEQYTATEPCCNACGLVYVTPIHTLPLTDHAH